MGSRGVTLRVVGAEDASTPRWGRVVGRPLVIGHRGAAAIAPENTLASFRAAREAGADGVELDVQLSSDGEVIVFHDEDLARLAGRPGRVSDFPLAALRELRLRGGGAIPTLDEVLEELGRNLLVNVELKVPPRAIGRALGRRVAEVLSRHAATGRALVSSFHPVALAVFRSDHPQLATGLLFHREQAWPLRAGWPHYWLRPLALHPDRTLVTPGRLRRWRRHGYAIHVWTVNDPAEMQRLADLGVDAIITDDPARARAALA